MADVVEFIVRVKDMMSGGMQRAAATAQNAFSAVDRAIARTQRNTLPARASINQLNERLDNLRRTRDVSIDTRQIRDANREIQRLERQLEETQNLGRSKSGSSGGGMFGLSSIVGGNLIASGIQKAAGTVKEVIAGSMDAAMEFGKNSKSFEVLTGSIERGKELTNQLRQLKQETIMGASVYKNAQTMMGFGIGNGEVIKDLRMIGDVAMGDQDKMAALTLAFSQTRAGGRLMGQDLLQYINAGFNPLSVMSKNWEQFGFKAKKSVGELKDMMSDGKISADMVTKAFELATSKGGMFYNMMDQIGETAAGKMQKLKGNWAAFQIDLGNALMPIATGFMEAASDTLHYLNISKTVPETLLGEKLEIDNLVGSITTLNQGNQMRGQMIDTLKAKYPDLFGNIDREKASNEELLGVLNKVNDAYDKRIELAQYDLVSSEASKEIKNLMDLATKARVQADYSEKNPGLMNSLKYMGVWDHFKMQNTGLPQGNSPAELRTFADQAMKKITDLQGTKNGADYTKRKKEAEGLINEAANLAARPIKQKELWGNATDKKSKELTSELAAWDKLVKENGGKFSGSLLSHDFSKLRNLLHPGAGGGGLGSGGSDASSAITGSSTKSTSDSITGGGKKSIVININREMIAAGGVVINTQTMGEGMADFEDHLEEALLRILHSANAVS